MNRSRAVVSAYVGVLFFDVFVFLGAGTLAYRQGWLYVVLSLVGVTLNQVLLPKGSDVAAERARTAGAGESWDKRLLGAYFAFSIVLFVTAGLDSGRFGWTGPLPVAVPIAGVVLMVAGQVLFALSMRANAFFSGTVRLQPERGQHVVDTGPYRFVRHPGYLGMAASLLAFPLVMESAWALLPAFAGLVLLLVRTLLEDRMLQAGLPGYVEYAKRTRYRLVPGIF